MTGKELIDTLIVTGEFHDNINNNDLKKYYLKVLESSEINFKPLLDLVINKNIRYSDFLSLSCVLDCNFKRDDCEVVLEYLVTKLIKASEVINKYNILHIVENIKDKICEYNIRDVDKVKALIRINCLVYSLNNLNIQLDKEYTVSNLRHTSTGIDVFDILDNSNFNDKYTDVVLLVIKNKDVEVYHDCDLLYKNNVFNIIYNRIARDDFDLIIGIADEKVRNHMIKQLLRGFGIGME